MNQFKRRPSGLAPLTLLVMLALLTLLVIFGGPGRAGPNDVPASLREQAVRACTGDALRLCPETLPDEQATVACMAGRRAQLGTACRKLYDRVVRLLKR